MRHAVRQLLPRVALLVACAVGLLGGARPGFARETDDTPEGLRQELLAGQTTGAWASTLDVVLTRTPPQVAEVLAPLFLDPAEVRHPDLLAFVATYLVAHPVQEGNGPRIRLADLVLAHAADVEPQPYLARIRDAQTVDRRTGRSATFDLLLSHARETLTAPWTGPQSPGPGVPAAVRVGAVAAIAFRPGDDVRLRLTWLSDGVRALPPRTEGGDQQSAERARVDAALLEAFRDLLAYPFTDTAQAVGLLATVPSAAVTHVDLLKHFSARKDASVRDRELVFRYGLESIQRLDGPAALAKAVVEDLYPYPELRRALIYRAGDLKPRPGAGWEPFFIGVCQRFSEPEVVLAALDLLVTAGFGTGQRECCPEDVARAVQVRLQAPRRPPDPPEVRLRLTRALGDLAVPAPLEGYVRHVLEARELPPVDEVVELLLAVGRCPGGRVDWLRSFYVRDGLSAEVREALRMAVARALRLSGVVGGDGEAAGDALAGILDGTPEFERDPSPKVRGVALRSLAWHPRPWTVQYLLRLARASGGEAEEAEAQLALQVIGQMASVPGGGELAAAALVAFLDTETAASVPQERRLLALKRAKDVAVGDGVLSAGRDSVRRAVRNVLESPAAGDELRLQALRSAADLGDPEALAPAVAWFAALLAAGKGEGVRDPLRGLFEAVVRLGNGREGPGAPGTDADGLVAQALRSLASLPRQRDATLSWVETLVRAAARAGAPRPLLLLGQAQLLLDRAGLAETPAPQRAADRAGARALLTAALPTARTPEEGDRIRLPLLDALEALSLEPGEAPATAALLYEALSIAARGADPAVWKTGERLGRRLLGQEGLKSLLGPAEALEAERLLAHLEEALAKPR